MGLPLDSPAINASTTVAINVMWTGCTWNSLSREFITALSVVPTGGVSSSLPVAMPLLGQSSYVFGNDSFALINSPASHPRCDP